VHVRVLHERIPSHALHANDGVRVQHVLITYEDDCAPDGFLDDDVLNDALNFLVDFGDFHEWPHAHADDGSPGVINACYKHFPRGVPNGAFFRTSDASAHVRGHVLNGIPLVPPPSKARLD
jgi:hypothetical protein